jgi:hypothetical protein
VKRLRLVALLFSVAAVTALSLAVASPASANGSFYPIQNTATGMCLQPVAGALDDGEAIVQEHCDGSIAQGWAPISLGGSSYHFLNELSGLCLDARGGAANGTPIQQFDCSSISNEKWDANRPLPDNIVTLTSRVSGTNSFCLDVPGAQAINGLAMQLFRCNGTVAQLWPIGSFGTVVEP